MHDIKLRLGISTGTVVRSAYEEFILQYINRSTTMQGNTNLFLHVYLPQIGKRQK